jgi:hypothetical protein
VTLAIAITDRETGSKETVVLADGDYFIVCTNPCYVDGIQTYPAKGTHVLTVKNHRPQPLPEEVS